MADDVKAGEGDRDTARGTHRGGVWGHASDGGEAATDGSGNPLPQRHPGGHNQFVKERTATRLAWSPWGFLCSWGAAPYG
jgi:hypothetical protein